MGSTSNLVEELNTLAPSNTLTELYTLLGAKYCISSSTLYNVLQRHNIPYKKSKHVPTKGKWIKWGESEVNRLQDLLESTKNMQFLDIVRTLNKEYGNSRTLAAVRDKIKKIGTVFVPVKSTLLNDFILFKSLQKEYGIQYRNLLKILKDNKVRFRR